MLPKYFQFIWLAALVAVAAVLAVQPLLARPPELREMTVDAPGRSVVGIVAAATDGPWIGVLCSEADETLRSHLKLENGLVVACHDNGGIREMALEIGRGRDRPRHKGRAAKDFAVLSRQTLRTGACGNDDDHDPSAFRASPRAE